MTKCTFKHCEKWTLTTELLSFEKCENCCLQQTTRQTTDEQGSATKYTLAAFKHLTQG